MFNTGGANKKYKKNTNNTKNTKNTKKKGGRAFTYTPFTPSAHNEQSVHKEQQVHNEPLIDKEPSVVQSLELQNGGKKKRKPGKYALYVKKMFPIVAKEHPNWKATDCMKEIAKRWKNQ